MTLSIETRHVGARAIVFVLQGELAYDTAQDVRFCISMVLLSGDVDAIAVDLAGVTFLDASGIGTLVVAQRICCDVDVDFCVRNPNPFVARLFTLLGVAEVLGVRPVAGLQPRDGPADSIDPAADSARQDEADGAPQDRPNERIRPDEPTPATGTPPAPAPPDRPPLDNPRPEGTAPGYRTAAAP